MQLRATFREFDLIGSGVVSTVQVKEILALVESRHKSKPRATQWTTDRTLADNIQHDFPSNSNDNQRESPNYYPDDNIGVNSECMSEVFGRGGDGKITASQFINVFNR